MTEEAAELRDKLEKAEERRQEAVKGMEAAQVEIRVLQNQMAELREHQVPYSWFICTLYRYSQCCFSQL